MTFAFILVGTLLIDEAGHASRNALYRELLRVGVAIGPDRAVPLPEPAMPDGLDAPAQRAALEAVIGRDYTFRDFVRPSPVAPFKLQLRDVEGSDDAAPARGLDVFFVAFGDLEDVASEEFLNRNLDRNRDGGEAHALTPEELASRGIELEPGREDREGFAHLVVPLLDRVQVGAVVHVVASRTDESIVAAGRVDRRFLDDDEYPNRWRPIVRRPGGRDELGAPRPYDGVGYYVKLTRLAEPEGALFVEAHLIFVEPKEWFDGANLLRSKLPPVIQSLIRDFRRELMRAAR